MVEKYYTPTIEEFHVGFEYEKNNEPYRRGYDKEIFTEDDMYNDNFMYHFDVKNTRVKYLDKQDIEELGWHSEMVINVWSEDDDIIDGYVINQSNTDTYVLLYSEEDNIVGIYLQRIYNEMSGNWEEHRLFSGYIKNKSELKNIMKMINIF